MKQMVCSSSLGESSHSPFIWKYYPIFLSFVLFIIGYIFLNLEKFGLCREVVSSFSSGNGGTPYCIDSFPYFQNMGETLSILGFYVASSFIIFLIVGVQAQVIRLWIFAEFIWIFWWIILVDKTTGMDEKVFIFGFIYFFLSLLVSIIYAGYLKQKNKESLLRLVLGFIFSFLLVAFAVFLFSSFSFSTMG